MKESRDLFLCLFLAAASLLLLVISGAIALHAYQAAKSPALIKQIAVNNNPSEPGKSVPPVNTATPAAPPAPAVPQQTVRVLNLDKLMQMSRPGMIISDYITRYTRLMDDGITKITESAVAAEKKKDLGLFASLNNDKQYLLEQKNKVANGAKQYLRDIVNASLKQNPLPAGTILIDANSSYTRGTATDFTDEMIRRLSTITPQMPELPTLEVLNPKPKPEPAKAPAKSAKKK